MKIKMLVILILFSFFAPNVFGIGLSPPQLRLMEAPMGEDLKVASVVITNTNTEPDHIVLQISCLDRSRGHKLRVICNGCSRDVGIQRGDLIDGACPFCASKDLVIYDFPPDNILDNITLKCASHPLEKKGSRQYYTVDELQPGETIEVDIYISIPNSEPYYDKHWEARIMATSVDSVEGAGEFIVYGVEAKFLIDTQMPEEVVEEVINEDEDNNPYVILGVVGLAGIIVTVFIIAFVKTKKEDVFVDFSDNPNPSKKSKKDTPKRIKRGRKIL